MHYRHDANIPNNKTLMSSYGEWMVKLEREGFEPYLLTFMLNHIPGSSLSVKKVMREEIERVYGQSLTHLVRHPHSAGMRDLLPRWIGCPDYPVGKGVGSLRDVSVNAGRHMHVIAMVFHQSRLKVPFHLHLLEHSERYVRAPLYRLDAVPIRDHLAYVSEYALKQLARGRASGDDLIILPRSYTEMAGPRTWVAHEAR